MKITNAQLILPDRTEAGSLSIAKGRIERITTGKARGAMRTGDVVDLKGGYLAPGFIDLHVHGAMGRDTMEASVDAFRDITEFHLRGGTTGLTLTTLTAPEDAIIALLKAVAPLQEKSLGGSKILGVHLEGPFISPAKPGAQDPDFIRPPRREEWSKFLKFKRLITQMTLAPESEGALDLIRALRKNGSIASAGHTNATAEQLVIPLKNGLNQSTHTFNAMSSMEKKGALRIPGMLEFALAETAICCELIADGVHVPPIAMKMLFNAKGDNQVCLVTDATAGAGLGMGTEFGLGKVPAVVKKESAFMVDGSGLAGSTLTMIRAVQNAVELCGLPLWKAVRMASLNPARQLGRQTEVGSLEKGKRADLVWFNDRFQVQAVWLDGDLRYMV